MTPLEGLDYLGVALFAATGALAASRKQLDIIGFLFLAAATGIGGGTLKYGWRLPAYRSSPGRAPKDI